MSGTKLDPRKDPTSFKRMNSIQLKAHIARMDTFVSRDVSYVKGAKTAPLTGNLWQTYKALETAVNRKNAKPFESIQDQFLSSLGMTAAQYQATKPTHPVTGNPSSRAPHIPIDRSSKGIPNDKQVKKLIRDMKARLDDGYTAKVLARDRRIARKMLKDIGAKDIIKDQRSLTPGQFSFMWNYTHFANAASFDYETVKARMMDPTALAAHNAQFDTQLREMRKIIADVKKMNL